MFKGDSKRLYFAYGANMNIQAMSLRCKSSEYLGVAILKEFRFEINSLGVATVIPDTAHSVYGILWLLSKEDEEQLDYFEGVEQNYYYKRKHAVYSQNSPHKQSALIYIATDNQPGCPRKDYIEDIISSAKLEGFEDEYLIYLETFRKRISWITK